MSTLGLSSAGRRVYACRPRTAMAARAIQMRMGREIARRVNHMAEGVFPLGRALTCPIPYVILPDERVHAWDTGIGMLWRCSCMPRFRRTIQRRTLGVYRSSELSVYFRAEEVAYSGIVVRLEM